MAKLTLPLGGQIVTLDFKDFSEEMDVDSMMSIDYSNLYGEAVTVSALLNKVGLLKAETESAYSTKVLETSIYEAELSKRFRREANINEGKFSMMVDDKLSMVKLTEGSLQSAILLDPIYQNHKKAVIGRKRDLDMIDSLYWAVQSKDRKLSVLLKGVTPEEFYNELVDGVVNSILIKKMKDNWTTKRE